MLFIFLLVTVAPILPNTSASPSKIFPQNPILEASCVSIMKALQRHRRPNRRPIVLYYLIRGHELYMAGAIIVWNDILTMWVLSASRCDFLTKKRPPTSIGSRSMTLCMPTIPIATTIPSSNTIVTLYDRVMLDNCCLLDQGGHYRTCRNRRFCGSSPLVINQPDLRPSADIRWRSKASNGHFHTRVDIYEHRGGNGRCLYSAVGG